MKLRWNTLGGKLGLFFCVARFAVMWAGWNGAASYNDIRKQFPYLISGGLIGLAVVVIGVGLMIIQSQRADQVQLEANLTELRNILERMTGLPTSNGAAESDTNRSSPALRRSPPHLQAGGRPGPPEDDHRAGGGRQSRGLPYLRPGGGAEVDLASTAVGKRQSDEGRR